MIPLLPRLQRDRRPRARRLRPPRRDQPGHRRRRRRRSSSSAAPASSAAGCGDGARTSPSASSARPVASPMIARTLGQHAVPTTFATVTGRWCDGLGEAAAGGSTARRPPAGRARRAERRRRVVRRRATRRSLGHFAARLGLAAAPAPATPNGRGSPPSPARGASPRRRAPRSASTSCSSPRTTSARSPRSRRAPAGRRRCRTSATRSPPSRPAPRRCRCRGSSRRCCTRPAAARLERAAGAWHAEWPALNGLLRATGSAAQWVGESLRPAASSTPTAWPPTSPSQEHRSER